MLSGTVTQQLGTIHKNKHHIKNAKGKRDGAAGQLKAFQKYLKWSRKMSHLKIQSGLAQ